MSHIQDIGFWFEQQIQYDNQYTIEHNYQKHIKKKLRIIAESVMVDGGVRGLPPEEWH